MAESPVTIDDERQRFEVTLDGRTAYLTFRRDEARLVLIHTEVPPELGGRGLGSTIARAALDYARSNDLTVVPECEFVRSFLERHPDEATRVRIEPPR